MLSPRPEFEKGQKPGIEQRPRQGPHGELLPEEDDADDKGRDIADPDDDLHDPFGDGGADAGIEPQEIADEDADARRPAHDEAEPLGYDKKRRAHGRERIAENDDDTVQRKLFYLTFGGFFQGKFHAGFLRMIPSVLYHFSPFDCKRFSIKFLPLLSKCGIAARRCRTSLGAVRSSNRSNRFG